MLFNRKKAKEKESEKLVPNKPEEEKSYWAYVRSQFAKNRRAMFSFYVVLFLAFIAIFADFLANEKPIFCKHEGKWSAPVIKAYAVNMGIAKWPEKFQKNVDWQNLEYDFAIWPLIPYLPRNHDYSANFVGPFDKQEVKSAKWRHWLGTDNLGRDLLAGMIHGTRIAFLVGIVAMSVAFSIGVFIGSLAGFFGDNTLKMSRIRIITNIIFFFLALFYGFISRSYEIDSTGSFLFGVLIFVGIMLLGNLLVIPLKRIPFLGNQTTIPMDILVTRLIEIVVSIPTLVLVLAIVSITKPSIINVMLVIGFVRWTGIARFIRAELLRVRQLEYIEAASALGFSKARQMLKHAIPNALSPVFISVAFGIAAAILIESFLSFLGIGIPAEMITWGKLLAIARDAPSAWWLAVFPGFAIFITVTMFNLIGEGLTDALDPRLKQ